MKILTPIDNGYFQLYMKGVQVNDCRNNYYGYLYDLYERACEFGSALQ